MGQQSSLQHRRAGSVATEEAKVKGKDSGSLAHPSQLSQPTTVHWLAAGTGDISLLEGRVFVALTVLELSV